MMSGWVDGESRPAFPERSVTAAATSTSLFHFHAGDSRDDSDRHALAHNDDNDDNNDQGRANLAKADEQ